MAYTIRSKQSGKEKLILTKGLPIARKHAGTGVFRAEFRKFLSCFFDCCPRKQTESEIREQQLRNQSKFKQQLQQSHQNQRRFSLSK